MGWLLPGRLRRRCRCLPFQRKGVGCWFQTCAVCSNQPGKMKRSSSLSWQTSHTARATAGSVVSSHRQGRHDLCHRLQPAMQHRVCTDVRRRSRAAADPGPVSVPRGRGAAFEAIGAAQLEAAAGRRRDGLPCCAPVMRTAAAISTVAPRQDRKRWRG
jgi:hypothetical protein